MAEYCNQCAEYWGFDPDFVGVTTKEAWDNGEATVVLCEGCGYIQVDPAGNCITDECNCRGHKVGRDLWYP